MFDSKVADAAAQWHDCAVALAAGVTLETPGPAAAEILADAVAATRQGELTTCLSIERCDRTGEFARDGAATTNAFVQDMSDETRAWAAKRIAIGRALLDRMPTTLAAWHAGRLGLDHAWQILKATADITDLDLQARIEADLANATPDLSPSGLKALGERIREQHVPDQTDKKNAGQHATQKLSISETLDGMWDFSGRFSPEYGAIIKNMVDAFTAHPSAEEILADPALAMTPGQRRASALVEICRQAREHSEGCNGVSGGRGSLIVAIPLKDLQAGRGVGDVAGGSTLSAAVLRRWACDTGIIPSVLGGDSEILNHGRSRRLASTGQRIYLAARDGGCVFPGCDRPPSWCIAHHLIHWLDNGLTDVENLHLLCVRHHHLMHGGGWTMTVADPQTLNFFPPNGRPPLISKRKPLIPTPRQPKTPHTATRNTPTRT